MKTNTTHHKPTVRCGSNWMALDYDEAQRYFREREPTEAELRCDELWKTHARKLASTDKK